MPQTESHVARSRPPFTAEDAARVALEFWGLTGDCASLPGDRDRNFRVRTAGDELRVLKFVHRDEDPAFAAVQRKAMRAAASGSLSVPEPQPTLAGEDHAEVVGQDGTPYQVLLFSWVDGIPWAEYRPRTRDMLAQFGGGLAELDRALATLDEAALRREFDWDVRQLHAATVPRLRYIHDVDRRALVQRHIERYDAALIGDLPTQAIHNDANEYNVLVAGTGYSGRPAGLGLIDFGDMVESWRVADVAVAAAYLTMESPDPVGDLAALAGGYHEVSPLTEAEIRAIPLLVAARLCISVCHSAERSITEPDDPYQTISQAGAWALLETLDAVCPRLVAYRIRAACRMEPCPAGGPLRRWLETSEAAPVLDIPLKGPIFDLSVGTTQFDGGLDPTDAAVWLAPFAAELERAGADVAFGRYLEPRICYRAGQFRTGGRGPERQRTRHLGVDLFAPAGTGVHAPFDAVVESVANNNQPLDYGPTVILRHDADGTPFWTLYGHLGGKALDALGPGDRLAKGERFADLGATEINGGWPPHLHFQIYADDLDAVGNLPGVAFASQVETWRSICPNPDLILRTGLPLQYEEEDPSGLISLRRAVTAPNLSLSYEPPLHIVRGIGAFLFDHEGRGYLDCVNNVCHIGHAHPAVVRAASRQLSVLNTNTRYLHRNLLDYAASLSGTLPEGLDVCFFVNSGSEANDLALRLARAATGRRGTVVLEGGYHGNLTSLVAVSPYKFDGRGGEGAPRETEVARMPDAYRNPGVGGPEFAGDVARAARVLTDRGVPAAAFLAESILSCGGQIEPPPGFLRAAYEHARASGALCIADEVQTGFGRVGRAMWAFELQGVVPDIVTMGKPIGNGFPLGAVVTTRAVAEAFANGMEYFNTYGGNPVSCAVGLAVLETIRQEGLQQQAQETGEYLKAGLRALAERHRLIGDVRGQGLFLGFELVRDRDTLEPAPDAAAWLAGRMRDLGVLISTDGPLHNVIKLKPPMVFSRADADELLSKLEDVFNDSCLA